MLPGGFFSPEKSAGGGSQGSALGLGWNLTHICTLTVRTQDLWSLGLCDLRLEAGPLWAAVPVSTELQDKGRHSEDVPLTSKMILSALASFAQWTERWPSD